MALWVPGGCNSTYNCRDLVGGPRNKFPILTPLTISFKKRGSSRQIGSFPHFLGGQNDKASFETTTKSPSHYLTGVAGNPTTEYDHPYTLEVQTPSFITSFIINRKMAATTSRVYTITNQGLLKRDFCAKNPRISGPDVSDQSLRDMPSTVWQGKPPLDLVVNWKIVDGRNPAINS